MLTVEKKSNIIRISCPILIKGMYFYHTIITGGLSYENNFLSEKVYELIKKAVPTTKF